MLNKTPLSLFFGSLLVAAGALSSLPACDGGETTASSSSSSSGGTSICADDPRVEPYAVGLSAEAPDGITVTMMDASPAPPAKGNNAITIQIADKDGNPLSGVDVSFKAYMPDHGHSSSIIPDVTEQGGGKYKLSPINLFMPGVWELTFGVTAPGAPMTSNALFTLCIDG